MNEKTPEEVAKEIVCDELLEIGQEKVRVNWLMIRDKITDAIRTERAAADELMEEGNQYLKAAKSIRNGDTNGFYLNDGEPGKNTIWMISDDEFKKYYALRTEVDELRKENAAMRIFAKKAVEILREFRNLYVTEKDIDTLLTDPTAKEIMKEKV